MGKRTSPLRRFAPLLLAAILLPLLLWFAAQGVGRKADAEALRLMEQAVRRAAVQCYALEGFYPTRLDYLQEHYGVSVNTERYLVDYRYIGSNLLPDITVLPLS